VVSFCNFVTRIEQTRGKKEDGRRKKEEGRWKKEEGRKMEEGRGKR
jgi:hypothetical protein